MGDVRGGPGNPRPVTEDAVQRAIVVRRVCTADTVRRRIVRDDDRADRIVTIVLMRQRRPDTDGDEREQRSRANRSCPGTEPPQHDDPACHPLLERVKTPLPAGVSREGGLGAVALREGDPWAGAMSGAYGRRKISSPLVTGAVAASACGSGSDKSRALDRRLARRRPCRSIHRSSASHQPAQIFVTSDARLGVGGDATGYLVPDNLQEAYGSPVSFHVFLRYRPGKQYRAAVTHVH